MKLYGCPVQTDRRMLEGVAVAVSPHAVAVVLAPPPGSRTVDVIEAVERGTVQITGFDYEEWPER